MTRGQILKAALILAAATGLGACSLSSGSLSGGYPHDSSENFSTATYGPATARLVSYGHAVPKGGGHYMVGDPYRIAGKTYIPQEKPAATQVGIASWYGYDFHGRETANGEIYDLDGVTAASPTMPLPSYARVTNLDNGKSITVRVNDRGPFVEGRIMDVSRTVARKLDFEDEGTAKVKVDYLGPAPLDGNDGATLLASYREPGGGSATPSGSPILIAAAKVPVALPVLVSAPTLQSAAPRTMTTLIAASSADVPLAAPVPRPAPVATTADPITPVILRSGLSYAATPAGSPAQAAADGLARSDLSTQLALAAAKKAQELGLRGPLSP